MEKVYAFVCELQRTGTNVSLQIFRRFEGKQPSKVKVTYLLQLQLIGLL